MGNCDNEPIECNLILTFKHCLQTTYNEYCKNNLLTLPLHLETMLVQNAL